MTTDFQSILAGAKLGEIEKPKPLPTGSYIGLIKSVAYDVSRGEKKTPFARINIELIQALDDVNQDDLASAGGVQGKKTKVDFYLTDDALFRLQEFVLDHVGLDSRGVSLDQALPMLQNMPVGVSLKQEVSQKDPSVIYSIVDNSNFHFVNNLS